jgi:hypothetical protein
MQSANNFAACPKCGHAPLPADQSLPATCPACGLVLAKFGTAPARPLREVRAADPDTAQDTGADENSHSWLGGWLLHVPAQVSRLDWHARAATLAAFAVWTLWIWRDANVPLGESGSYFLHVVLTPFHEAGHYAIFRWFGPFIMTLGGTLGQHLMPIVVAGALLVQRRDPFGAAIFTWLLGYSVLDMGVYMYDAYDLKLMLLDGKTGVESDGHDWQNIFGDLGLLKHARGIGVFWGWAGRALMLAALSWAGWVLLLQRERLSDSLFAEEMEDSKRL